MSDKHRVHIFVSGRVQGVFFRDFTYRKANELGLTGWVRNTNDGKVEIIAEGDSNKLNQLIEAVRIGPENAKVQDCQVSWNNFTKAFTDFKVIY